MLKGIQQFGLKINKIVCWFFSYLFFELLVGLFDALELLHHGLGLLLLLLHLLVRLGQREQWLDLGVHLEPEPVAQLQVLPHIALDHHQANPVKLVMI